VTVVRAVTGTLPVRTFPTLILPTLIVPALLLLTLVVGCSTGESAPTGSPTASGAASETGATASGMPSSSPSLPPAPRRLTPEADGGHYSMTVGSTTALVVPDQGVDQPAVDGTSVLLVPVVNVTDSGVREWEVRGVEVGTSTITSGTPAFTITFTVG
jgi:hypothetical protein